MSFLSNSRKILSVIYFLYFIQAHGDCFASTTHQRIPDEFESVGGHGLGFSNAGSVSNSGLSSIRTNPAMLSIEKTYSIYGGYHWPTFGRDFYQAGAVDGTTSSLAAGLVYTSFTDDFKNYESYTEESKVLNTYYDSPIKYRLAGAMAQSFKNISLGIGGQYISAILPSQRGFNVNDQESAIKTATIGLGVAGLLTKDIRFGVSVENIANTKIKEIAPLTTRAGIAYLFQNGFITGHLDYIRRDRVYHELNIPNQLSSSTEKMKLKEFTKPEQLLTGSGSIRVYDLLRILFAGGFDMGESDRKLFSAGLALVNQKFTLSYLFGKPYVADSSAHHAINFSTQVAI